MGVVLVVSEVLAWAEVFRVPAEEEGEEDHGLGKGLVLVVPCGVAGLLPSVGAGEEGRGVSE